MLEALKRIAIEMVSVAIAFVGGFALNQTLKGAISGTLVHPMSDFALAGGLLVLGAAGLVYARVNYRGGAYSIVGAFFLLAGIHTVAGILDEGLPARGVDAAARVGAAFITTLGGVLLLVAGHRRNNDRTRSGQAT